MNRYGAIIEPGTIEFERTLPGPIERVWAHLTESDLRGRWLASGDMDLREGGRAELRFLHAELTDTQEPIPERFKGFEHGQVFERRVLRCEPPRLLAMTWSDEPDPSEVTFELSPQGSDVRLVLTHRRLTPEFLVMVAAGWHTCLDILVEDASGEARQPFWSNWLANEAQYAAKFSDS